jgi:hypothetical protein
MAHISRLSWDKVGYNYAKFYITFIRFDGLAFYAPSPNLQLGRVEMPWENERIAMQFSWSW